MHRNEFLFLKHLFFAIITGLIGVFIIGIYLNHLSAFLGILSLGIYAFAYTPLKRFSRISVPIGAIPGAIPPLLGWVAATGEIGIGGIILFFIQFFWQFPHFWSIAWLLDDDYKRAGYKMLPSLVGRDKKSILFIIITTIIMVALSVFPYIFSITGLVSLLLILPAGFYMIYKAIRLYFQSEIGNVKEFMIISIVYNTLVLLAFSLNTI